MLVIDPDECIDCTLCAPRCLVDAVVPGEGAEGQKYFLELSRDRLVSSERKAPPPDADDRGGREGTHALPALGMWWRVRFQHSNDGKWYAASGSAVGISRR